MALSLPIAPQPLAAIAPATSRWIDDALGRHTVTLLCYVAGIAFTGAIGVRVDWHTYVVMAVWIGSNLFIAPWAARPHDFQKKLTRYAWTIVMDVLFLGVVYYYLDAAQWLGMVFFIQSALVASATLPRKWALGVAGLIVVEYSALVLYAVLGSTTIVSPLGLHTVQGNYAYATASIIGAVGMVAVLMLLQSRLVETIRDAEQRYMLLVQSAPDMVMTFDERGRFVDVNPATLKLTGYSWEEIKELPNTAFFPPEDWPKIMEARAKNMAGQATSLEIRCILKSGEVRWLQTTSAPYRRTDERGAVLVIARDVTEERRRNDTLRANDERFRMIVNSLELGFYTLDVAERITAIYGRWAQQQLAIAGTLVGKRARDFFPPAVAALHDVANRSVLAGEDVSFRWTTIIDGTERHVRTHLAPLRDADRRVTGVAGVWTEETAAVLMERERERLQDRVADAERIESLGKLVSGVAHELNNPLAAILNFTEDLLADVRPDEDRMALQVIQAQALRSRTIVRDLLTYVRKGDRRPRKPETPGPILETLIRAVKPGLATQGVSFVASVGDPDTPMLLDRSGFEQVVTNLVTNAAQAAGAGGAVRLSAGVEGDSYVVIVEDNGAGIREEHFARIFEPFFTTKPTGQGVGLGLSVSLGIVQAHGGSLHAENRGADAGGGARFTVRFGTGEITVMPAAPEPPVIPEYRRTPPGASITQAADQTASLPARRPSLLVIDDEESIRRALRRYFERRGWAVDEAGDGTDALVKLLKADATVLYDVVLCDLKMPGVSGQELYRRLRTDAPAMASRLILCTGDVSAPDVAGFLATVTIPVLEKPFELITLELLAEQVRQAVSGPAGARQE